MADAIMIQGTMSNAGKSLFAAALCRIFMQDGYKCAPFKSQNMALNSFITQDGLEIGRAQAMQAEAAGTEPSVYMNPILLKPTTDTGSQVIVNGKAIANMKAADYFQYKKQLVPEIMNAYNKLVAENDIIVIEGAGSPVELNLKADDIVNMGMAKLADSPVLLVGDIDRGGVFAQLLGTLWLLDEDERQRVKGLVVNKFRGDRALFESGVKILEEKGGVPVAGVVPYMDIDIDEEDSLSHKLRDTAEGVIDIAVIRLPRISNFTDFDVFSQYDGISVRYVSQPEDLKTPDLIIIPGTKSTISDMRHIRENGLENTIKKSASDGIPVYGVCGGYQMMGKKISDPHNTECGGEIQGMNLLDCETVFVPEKTRTRISGVFEKVGGIFAGLSGKHFEGYEIHLGETKAAGSSLVRFSDGKTDGAHLDNIYGSYVHGIFDSAEVSGTIVKALYAKKGLPYSGKSLDRKEYKERQYNKLADIVRENIDMNMIYKIIRNTR